MSTSTGGTLALQLAANYPEIAGLILYSPNIEVFNPSAPLLNNPWGLQIGRTVLKSNYVDIKYKDSAYPKYWNTHYRIEAVVALQHLLEATMTEATFKKIHQPTLALYYYKDEAHQDNVVKVSAIQKMMQQIAGQQPVEKEVKVVSLFYRKQVWMSSIAALLLVAIAIPVYFNMANETNLDASTIESYLAQQSVGTTELTKHLTDEDILALENTLGASTSERDEIEAYLSETENLDYILNE